MSALIESLQSKIISLNSKLDEMNNIIKEYKQMFEHQSKIIHTRDRNLKDIKAQMTTLTIANQSFKDKIEDLENELEALKEPA